MFIFSFRQQQVVKKTTCCAVCKVDIAQVCTCTGQFGRTFGWKISVNVLKIILKNPDFAFSIQCASSDWIYWMNERSYERANNCMNDSMNYNDDNNSCKRILFECYSTSVDLLFLYCYILLRVAGLSACRCYNWCRCWCIQAIVMASLLHDVIVIIFSVVLCTWANVCAKCMW